MTTPVHVTFRDLAVNPTLETLIHERADALRETFRDLLSCRVLVEIPHRHHRSGNRYHVRIELTVPGETIVATHQPSLAPRRDDDAPATKSVELDAESRDGALAIRDAFDNARRQLLAFRDRRNDRSHART
ncbi:MAG: HPF/RaiA family ribosome-associated protein [Vicinamibacterales bacterium]